MNSLKNTESTQRLLIQVKNISLMLLLLVLSFVSKATDLKGTMSVQPEQCVAMSQGQSCYVTVELSWEVEALGNYCLYTSAQSQALKCWHNTTSGEFKQSFDSKVNLNFSLKNQHEQATLASAVVKMAWVHKKKGRPRTSWRLF